MKLIFAACLIFALGTTTWARDKPAPAGSDVMSDGEFDAQFRCPESAQTKELANEWDAIFVSWVLKAHPTWTVRDVLTFRLKLLTNHTCTQTLKNIESYPGNTGG